MKKKYKKVKETAKTIEVTHSNTFPESNTTLSKFIKLLQDTEKELVEEGYDKESLIVNFNHEYCMEHMYYGSDFCIEGERDETDEEREERLAKAREHRRKIRENKAKKEAKERELYETLKTKFGD